MKREKIAQMILVLYPFLSGKLLERNIKEGLRKSKFIEMESWQFGFRDGCSTMNHLYQPIYDQKPKIFAKDSWVATVDDLKRAFDGTNNDSLIFCLVEKSLHGRTILLFESFLITKVIALERINLGIVFSLHPLMYRMLWSLLPYSS